MKVKKRLEKENVWHKIVDLPVLGKSTIDVIDHVSDDVDDIVKTIIIKVDNEFFAFCVRKDNVVDYKKLRSHFKTKKLRMAREDEVLEYSTSPPGGCCPLLVKCPVYFDDDIEHLHKVHMGSGSLEHSLEMETKDLIRLVKPKFLDVGSPK